MELAALRAEDSTELDLSGYSAASVNISKLLFTVGRHVQFALAMENGSNSRCHPNEPRGIDVSKRTVSLELREL